eukprot:514524_1
MIHSFGEEIRSITQAFLFSFGFIQYTSVVMAQRIHRRMQMKEKEKRKASSPTSTISMFHSLFPDHHTNTKGEEKELFNLVDEVVKWKRICEEDSQKKYYYYSLKAVAPHQENSLSLDHDWRAVPDKESGYYYFYNKSSRDVTWEKPPCITEWIKVRNEGEAYYYNIRTKE